MKTSDAANAVEHAANNEENKIRRERMHSWVAALSQLHRDHGEMEVVFPAAWSFDHHPQLAPGPGGSLIIVWGPMPGTPTRAARPGDSATKAEIAAQEEAKKDPKRFQREED